MGGLDKVARIVLADAVTTAGKLSGPFKAAANLEATLSKLTASTLRQGEHLVQGTPSGKALQSISLVADDGLAITTKGSSPLTGIAQDLNRNRLANPEGYARKVAALSDNAYSFFRGTVPQFNRRVFETMPKGLKEAPQVLLHGDAHVLNFAVVPGKKGLTYGLGDFDEALKGPASVDLARTMSSFVVAFGEKKDVLKAFLKGYSKGLDGTIHLKSEAITKLLKTSAGKTWNGVVKAETTTTHGIRQFEPSENTVTLSADVTQQIAKALKGSGVPEFAEKPLQDAVQAYGGTASLDLFRYHAVVGKGGKKDLILEIKELVPSALSPHLGPSGSNLLRQQGALKVFQGKSALPVAEISVNGRPMLVRIRPPYKGGVQPKDIARSDVTAFAEDLGKITGKAHARSGDGKALGQFIDKEGDSLIDLALKLAKANGRDFDAFRHAVTG